MNPEASVTALDYNPQSIRLGTSWLLSGGDAYLSDLVLDAIRTKLKKTDDIDLFIIYGDDVSASELYDQLDTLSIFSRAKLLIIRNAHKLGKKELEALEAYFQSPSEIQSVALVVDKVDSSLSAWKTIKAGCTTILCEPPRYGGALRAWLDKTLNTMNKSMTFKARDEFINRVELDYAYAANELIKLDILTGNRHAINEQDVLKSLGTTRTGAVIDFYRALGKRQTKEALIAVDKMLMSDWEPLQVFFHYTKFYTILWRIQVLKKAHFSEAEIISKHLTDVYQTQRREFVEFAKSFSLESLETIFPLLLDTDAQLKLSMAEPNILLTACLIKILAA